MGEFRSQPDGDVDVRSRLTFAAGYRAEHRQAADTKRTEFTLVRPEPFDGGLRALIHTEVSDLLQGSAINHCP